jgi:cell division protein FtsB
MREFQDRRRLKEFLHSRYAIGFLLLLIILLINAVWGIRAKYEKSKNMAATAAVDLEALKEREKILQDAVEALNTEEGKEKELRDRFGVVKEGERMIILVDEGVKEVPVEITKKSWWAKLWE